MENVIKSKFKESLQNLKVSCLVADNTLLADLVDIFVGRNPDDLIGLDGGIINQRGELVFQTGVVGYVETLTDPCYAGQIVMQTFPQIGNYGIAEEDICGDCCLQGYVVRQWCDTPSNFRSQYDLDTFLLWCSQNGYKKWLTLQKLLFHF